MRVTQLNTYVDYVIECAVLGSAYEGGLVLVLVEQSIQLMAMVDRS